MPRPYHRRKPLRSNHYAIDPDDPAVTYLMISRRDGSHYVVRISTSDRPLVSRRQWRVTRSANGTVHVDSGNRAAHVMLTRFLLGPRDDQIVNHINGDCLDHRRENLRATERPELARRTCPTRSKCGERCVYATRYGFVVRFTIDGTRHHVGSTFTLAGAIELRDAWLADHRQDT